MMMISKVLRRANPRKLKLPNRPPNRRKEGYSTTWTIRTLTTFRRKSQQLLLERPPLKNQTCLTLTSLTKILLSLLQSQVWYKKTSQHLLIKNPHSLIQTTVTSPFRNNLPRLNLRQLRKLHCLTVMIVMKSQLHPKRHPFRHPKPNQLLLKRQLSSTAMTTRMISSPQQSQSQNHQFNSLQLQKRNYLKIVMTTMICSNQPPSL